MLEPLPSHPAAGGQRGVVEAAAALHARGVRFALALVVDSAGSTYRKAGALALIGADRTRVGVLSGGCLEPEIERHAARALADRAPLLVDLDTRGDDDLLFGSGSGCRGRLRVMLLPDEHAAVAAVLEAARLRRALRLRCRLDAEAPALAFDGAGDGAPAGDERLVTIAAAPHLLLLGAGPEAAALTRIAREIGWYVTVADHRPALVDARRLPAADRVLQARPAPALAQLDGEAIDAVVLMSHSASLDREGLALLAERPIAYVDLLGPRARRDELLRSLAPDARARLATRLHGPAGLDLGGEGPESIALAIAAGLQRHFAGR
jgi:xanthine dehydrogenase accessory factor